MKRKILKIINKWLKERETIDEHDYDVRMCNAEDALFDIFKKANKPKVKKQMYCNFEFVNNERWDIISISNKPFCCVVDDIRDCNEEEFGFCSVPIEKFKKEV